MFNLRPLHGRIHTCSECRHMFIWFLSPRYFQESTVSYLLSFTHQFFLSSQQYLKSFFLGKNIQPPPIHHPNTHTESEVYFFLFSLRNAECHLYVSFICSSSQSVWHAVCCGLVAPAHTGQYMSQWLGHLLYWEFPQLTWWFACVIVETFSCSNIYTVLNT